MQKQAVKYVITFLFLLVYINRAVFVTPYELENHENKEINSVIEWVVEVITGEGNDIDEDGDMHTDCNSVNIAHHDFSQQLAQNLKLTNLFSKDIAKNRFPNKENFLIQDFCSQIDRPPEI